MEGAVGRAGSVTLQLAFPSLRRSREGFQPESRIKVYFTTWKLFPERISRNFELCLPLLAVWLLASRFFVTGFLFLSLELWVGDTNKHCPELIQRTDRICSTHFILQFCMSCQHLRIWRFHIKNPDFPSSPENPEDSAMLDLGFAQQQLPELWLSAPAQLHSFPPIGV